MGQLRYSTDVSASAHRIFAYLDDYRTAPHWIYGLSSLTPLTDRTSGVGAVYEAALVLGPYSRRRRCVTVTHHPGRTLGFQIAGTPPTTCDFTIAPLGRGRSVVTVELDYPACIGRAGRAWTRLIDTIVTTGVKHSERQLHREIIDLHGDDLVGRLGRGPR